MPPAAGVPTLRSDRGNAADPATMGLAGSECDGETRVEFGRIIALRLDEAGA
ncbi:MAG: hypothetical protein QOK29_1814, partial [Rhodospirillaceae bacterium]|nr:hypothetical protein [Rhodospirillaceae bacterium]